MAVVVDDSPESDGAAAWAAKEAVLREVPLEIVHATSTPHPPASHSRSAAAMQLMDQVLLRARAAAPGVDVRVRVEDGALMDLVRDESRKVGLLVLGAGGAGTAASELLSLPVNELVGSLGCPLVVLPTQDVDRPPVPQQTPGRDG